MQAARRLAAVVSVALIGSFALAGCQSDPTVAAYVGDTEITEAAVTRITDDFAVKKAAAKTAATPAPDQPQEQPDTPLGRVDVVTALVLNEGCKQLAAQKNLKPSSTVTAEQFAAQRGLPADSLYASLGAELTTCMSAVPAANRVPTEDELRELFDRAKEAKLLNNPDITFDDIKGQLAQDQQVLQAYSAKGLYDAVAGAASVSVNPRYRPLTVQAFPDTELVPITVGEPASDAVRG